MFPFRKISKIQTSLFLKFLIFFKEHHEKCIKITENLYARKSLAEFLEKDCNLAFNRQTRMLATFDANFTMCDYLEKRNNTNSEFFDNELLPRAKLGLESLTFFGLAEKQMLSHKLFIKTFNSQLLIKSRGSFKQNSFFIEKGINVIGTNLPATSEIIKTLNATVLKRIFNANRLDIILCCMNTGLNYFKID
jgi:hypothetical protein